MGSIGLEPRLFCITQSQCWWSNQPWASSIDRIQTINVLDNLGLGSWVSVVDPSVWTPSS